MSFGNLKQNDTTYYGILTSKINNKEQTVVVGWHESQQADLQAGEYGIFLSVIIVVMFGLMSAFGPVAVFMATFGLAFAKMLGLLILSWPVVITVILAGFVLSFMIHLKK